MPPKKRKAVETPAAAPAKKPKGGRPPAPTALGADSGEQKPKQLSFHAALGSPRDPASLKKPRLRDGSDGGMITWQYIGGDGEQPEEQEQYLHGDVWYEHDHSAPTTLLAKGTALDKYHDDYLLPWQGVGGSIQDPSG